MLKTFLKIFVALSIVPLVIAVGFFILFTVQPPVDPILYIFSDIDECENIETYGSEHAEITRYDSPTKDKYWDGLKYTAFYGANYTSAEFDFKIFAYEFQTSEHAMKYFENITGKKIIGQNVSGNDDHPETTFSTSAGATTYRRVVIDARNAYLITSSKKDAKDVEQFLSKVFSKKLDF